MELSPLLIYLVGQLPAINRIVEFMFVFGLILFFFAYAIQGMSFPTYQSKGEYERHAKIKEGCISFRKKCIPFIVAGLIGIVITPSRNTVAAMIIVPAVVNNAQVQNISQGALRWAEEYIKNQLEVEIKKTTKVK